LATRRAKVTPEQAGLPVYGAHRRVSGLRREEAALLAGISVEYYTRLERGNVGEVSDSVLDGVVHALQLDEAERDHLFRLVRTAATRRPSRGGPARRRIRPTPIRLRPTKRDDCAEPGPVPESNLAEPLRPKANPARDSRSASRPASCADTERSLVRTQ
jgi:transcriptional regulator with XRE-family HTH domain